MRQLAVGVSLAPIAVIMMAAARYQEAEPAADVAKGKAAFERRCTGCHALDRDKEGPRLAGVVGRKAGSVEGFPYSDALKGSAIVWDEELLNKWLAGPDTLVPGVEMDFHVPDAEERVEIIRYLHIASRKP
jgi:cytochrome c